MQIDVIQVQQWLTDISATRALDGLADGFDEAAISAKSFSSIVAKSPSVPKSFSYRSYTFVRF